MPVKKNTQKSTHTKCPKDKRQIKERKNNKDSELSYNKPFKCHLHFAADENLKFCGFFQKLQIRHDLS